MGKYKVKITAETDKQDVFITRDFDAPCNLVFKVFTDPKLIEQWAGPKDSTVHYDKFEAKNGGSWKSITKLSNGYELSSHGVIHEFRNSERLIQTYETEGSPEPGHVILQTYKFESLSDKKTRVIRQDVFSTIEDRNKMIQYNVEEFANDSMDRIDEILKKLGK